MPCSPLSVNRSFRGTYRLHLQGLKNKSARNPSASRWLATCLHAGYLPTHFSTLKMKAICSSETFVDNELHGVIFQKMVLFITTAVKTSNSTHLNIFSHRVRTSHETHYEDQPAYVFKEKIAVYSEYFMNDVSSNISSAIFWVVMPCSQKCTDVSEERNATILTIELVTYF
jgi:hypothetical protein